MEVRIYCAEAIAGATLEKDAAAKIKERLDMEEDFNQLPGKVAGAQRAAQLVSRIGCTESNVHVATVVANR